MSRSSLFESASKNLTRLIGLASTDDGTTDAVVLAEENRPDDSRNERLEVAVTSSLDALDAREPFDDDLDDRRSAEGTKVISKRGRKSPS
mmetsp:Transcript_34821/g.96105  ORF Transcript_34821/g.96105 Transcript_34821/m.96105 type:complete len:90 (-) Transcript_34821:52-321(-)